MCADNYKKQLMETTKKLLARGKGLLAIDETPETLGARFESIHLENTQENRKRYREMLLTLPNLKEQPISGVIFHHETIHQKTLTGTNLIDIVLDNQILAGIKLDEGLIPFEEEPDETISTGLSDLAERCERYRYFGCSFAKWRTAYVIDSNKPTSKAVKMNSKILAQFASVCQANGLVPIVEPEILTKGNHKLERAGKVAEDVFFELICALREHDVTLELIILKVAMVLPGDDCHTEYTPKDIGYATVTTLERSVPPAVAGIVFLSGNQSENDATVRLNSIRYLRTPWAVTFSFGRALQNSAMTVWNGKDKNIVNAQKEVIKRLQANSLACQGLYVE